MAERGWAAQIGTAAGVAAGVGAAQLGLGYGLGVLVWPVTATADDSVWLGSLGWSTWIAASATVSGAVIAARPGPWRGGPWRWALAASAAVGAVVTVALIAFPARAAVRPDTFSPQTIAAGYAVVGILLGFVITYWAVASRPVAANLVATAVWLWALAVAAVAVDLLGHRATATYLTSWQFADPGGDARYGAIAWPSAGLTLLSALVVGAVAAVPAVRRGDLGIGAAASGAVGPLLVAGSFLALAPQLTGAAGPIGSAYLIAPYAVLAGLGGSALTVAIGRRLAERPTRRTADVAGGASERPHRGSWRPTASWRRRAAGGGVPAPSPAAGPIAAVPAPVAQGRSPVAPPAAPDPAARARSTVAPPPADPPVAKINPPRAGG